MRTTTSEPLPGTTRDPLYPDTDGQPMGESDFHQAAIIWLREALEDYLAPRPRAYVASNMLLYFQRGNPVGRRDPDVLVALDVGRHRRRSFRTWEEGVVPDVLFEIASENTWREDLGDKREVYQRLGVPEYFLFDPEGLYLDAPLLGFRLESGLYVARAPDADGSLFSDRLGLRLRPEGAMLRLVLPDGSVVPTRSEQIQQARLQAEELAAEVARLRALLPRPQLNGNDAPAGT